MPRSRKSEREFVLTESEKIKQQKEIIKNIFLTKPKVSGKNDSQRNLIKSIKDNEITICSGIAGSGKAQPLNSKILSKNGFVELKDVNVGDEVYNENGELNIITGIFPQGKKDTYKITFSDNSTVECCDEHLWLTWNEQERNLWRGSKKKLKRVNHNGTVRTLNDIRKNVIVRDNRLNYSIPIVKPIKFSKKDLLVNPYLLGILLGDGCFKQTIKISSGDDEIIDECKNKLNENFYLKKSKSNKYDYSILNKIPNKKHSFRYIIEELGLLDLKSEEKFIPKNYLYSNVNDRIELLQGLMDSDGTINKNGTTFSFTSTSKNLILDLKFLIESLGGVINPIREKNKKYKYKGEIKIGKLSYIMSFRLPNEIIPFKLERKKNIIKSKTKYFPIRYIKEVEYVGKKENVCISVNNETSLYVTDNFIVTHNTYVSLAYALSLLADVKNKYTNIYLVKSVTTLKNEEVGFLKGDLQEKFEPFMMSFKINMEKVIDKSEMVSLFASEIVRPFPLAYIKGSSLDNCIILADECIDGDSKLIVSTDGVNKKHIKAKMLPFYFKKYGNLKVLSHNDVEHKDEFKLINSIRITKNKKTIKIKTSGNNNPLVVSENHPFAIIDNGNIKYKKASELKINDRLLKRKNKIGNHSILNRNNYDILLGFLLGDGCFQQNKQWDNNIFRLRKQHSLKQKEYNEFCSKLYNTTCNTSGVSGFNGENMSVFNTKSYYIESEFLDSIQKDGKKKINFNIKNFFTKRSLALWFMDDGSNYIYSDNGSNITLHTEGFNKVENEILKNILKENFELECNVSTYKKNRNDGKYNYYYVLTFNKGNSHKLQNLIKEYVHPSMDYKLNDEFKNKFDASLYEKHKNYYELTTTIINNIDDNDERTVYNMEVADNNNYYVNNILTHNCQNVSVDNCRTLMTRVGQNSKLVLLGDSNQIDLKNKEESCLEPIMKMFEDIENIGTIEMDSEDDNCRNPLIKVIEDKFKAYKDNQVINGLSKNGKSNGNGRQRQLIQ